LKNNTTLHSLLIDNANPCMASPMTASVVSLRSAAFPTLGLNI
jgi:hypothetical protein